jgi:hypothetical protein
MAPSELNKTEIAGRRKIGMFRTRRIRAPVGGRSLSHNNGIGEVNDAYIA